jgi:gas vesicle protein
MYSHNNEEIRDQIERGSSSVVGFMIGAAIGAGIALLLAPDSGRETRRRLKDNARRWSSSMRDGIDHARSRMGEVKEDVRTAVNTGRETFAREREARHGTTGNPTTQPIP